MTINQFITMPMIQTQMQLIEEIKPPKETNNFWSSIFFLLLSCLIGYMIFRIILMKVLSRKSLEPNPRLSQIDLDKHYRKIKDLEIENRNIETSLKVKEKDLIETINDRNHLQKEITKKESIIQQQQSQNESQQSKIDELQLLLQQKSELLEEQKVLIEDQRSKMETQQTVINGQRIRIDELQIRIQELNDDKDI